MKKDYFRSKGMKRIANVETSYYAGRYSTTVTFIKNNPRHSSERTKHFNRRKEGLKAAREWIA